MRPTFHPRLAGQTPFDDPGVFVGFIFEKRALLFDLGHATALSSRDLVKVSHAFVSHTHMDHFIGFDHLVRLLLGRNKHLFVYGPPGFLKNVEGHLSGYTWNLVENYGSRFLLTAAEVGTDEVITRTYACGKAFAPVEEAREPFSGILFSEPSLTVSATVLDHKTPCLGFALSERFHVNVLKDRLAEMGLAIGPWLARMKEALWTGAPLDSLLDAPAVDGSIRRLPLGEVREKAVRISPGQKIAYVTDVVASPENEARILDLAANADHLFIEAAFLHEDLAEARKKHHLTARQAGDLARRAGARDFTVFHISPRYAGRENELHAEALRAFSGE
ncbi:MAG: ribonuclease Z [Proteobacteria bacterium]|nr:ribonuclease Z [Pseudomonadota bacterium]